MKYISDILIIACMVIGATVTNKAAAQESRTLSQAECRTLALANNETMRNMPENDLTKAKLDKEIAFTSYLPKFSGSASAVYMLPDLDMMGMELQMIRNVHGRNNGNSTIIHRVGKSWQANKLASIGIDCAAENLRKTRMQILADTRPCLLELHSRARQSKKCLRLICSRWTRFSIRHKQALTQG